MSKSLRQASKQPKDQQYETRSPDLAASSQSDSARSSGGQTARHGNSSVQALMHSTQVESGAKEEVPNVDGGSWEIFGMGYQDFVDSGAKMGGMAMEAMGLGGEEEEAEGGGHSEGTGSDGGQDLAAPPTDTDEETAAERGPTFTYVCDGTMGPGEIATKGGGAKELWPTIETLNEGTDINQLAPETKLNLPLSWAAGLGVTPTMDVSEAVAELLAELEKEDTNGELVKQMLTALTLDEQDELLKHPEAMQEVEGILGGAGEKGWLESGIEAAVGASETLDEIDKAINPARWVRDAAKAAGKDVGAAMAEWAGSSGEGADEEGPSEAMKEPTGQETTPQGHEQTAEEASADTPQSPGEPQLQSSLIDEMMKLGYDEDGNQKTRYGGFAGKGTYGADGMGKIKILKTTKEPVARRSLREGEPKRYYTESGKLVSENDCEDVEQTGTKDFDCVGAVQISFAQALEGSGANINDKVDIASEGEESEEYTLQQLINIVFKKGGQSLKQAANADDGLLTQGRIDAELEADKLVDSGEMTKGSAEYKDFILRNSYASLMNSEKRDRRLGGAATALDLSGMGEEVNPADVKPGDTCQHWTTWKKGHATLIQVVEAEGVAKVDSSGKVSGNGTWQEGTFTMDDKTSPALVGHHYVQNVRRLGAHTSETADYNNEEEKAKNGIHTGKAAGIGTKKREYYGRPNNSPWKGWAPAYRTLTDAQQANVAPDPASKSPYDRDDDEGDGGMLEEWSGWLGSKLGYTK